LVDDVRMVGSVRMPPHGSPEDRGDSDYYYGRQYRPHKWLDGIGQREVELMDPDEIAAYRRGYENCDERKDCR
jgi:hypothetical protein